MDLNYVDNKRYFISQFYDVKSEKYHFSISVKFM